MKVFINPGHSPNGIPDPGVVSPFSGIQESDVAWSVGNHTSQLLQADGFDTVLLQTPELVDISRAANNSFADVFVSIHCNGSAYHTARGTETFHYPGSTYGNILAVAINNQITGSIPGIRNRGVKTANFHVLRCTNMPAVLTELAFLDNKDDAELLITYTEEFARAIARAISDFFA